LQLSHLDLKTVVINTSLSPLISYEIAKKHQIIPLWWIGNCLILGCNASTLPGNMDTNALIFDFKVQMVLCSEKQWKNAFRTIYLEGNHDHEPPEKDIIQTLQEQLSLAFNDLHRARIYSQQYDLSVLQSLSEMKIISPRMILSAKSIISGIPLVEINTKPKDEWLHLIPSDIARQQEIVSFAGDGEFIYVAGHYFTTEKIRMIESLTSLKVKPHYLCQTKIQDWLHQYYPQITSRSEEFGRRSLGEVLITTGILSKDQLAEALEEGSFLRQRLGDRLVSLGYLDDNDLAAALSLQTGLPYASLEHSNISQSLFQQFPKEIAGNYQVIPLFKQNNILWIASADPYNGRGFNEVNNAMECEVMPIIAPKKVVWAIIERVYGLNYQKLTKEASQSIQKLILNDYLTQTQANQMSQLLTTQKLSFDEAFVQASFYDSLQANSILAKTFAISSFDITLIEEERDSFDGLGERITKTVYRDPVKQSIAGLLEYETAKKLCILPVRKKKGITVVAFADPLQALIINPFEYPIIPVLSIRSDLEDAIERNLGHKNIGTYLLENNYITRRQLNEALELANQTGTRLGQALLIKQYVREKNIYRLLAQQSNLPYVELENYDIEEKTARCIDPEIEREFGMLPIEADENSVTLAIVDPINTEVIAKAEELTGKHIYPVVTSEEDLEKAFERIYSTDYTAISTSNLLHRSPRESAFKVLSKGQIIFFAAFLILSGIWMVFDFTSYVITINVLVTIFYIGFSSYKFYLIYHALNHDNEISISQEEIDALRDKDLPIYTLLVPVYKEAELLQDLLQALSQIDYPSTKLDIKILMEADDTETTHRFYELGLPPHFKGIIVPGSLPKTKPKACNYGLIHARGEYVVIFDAEDLPETDQLKKAVIAFQNTTPDVVCIQAKLNYFNRTQNLLTRWFTVEYSMWFDLFLPGLDASGAPIPLGGTSNHFKRRALVEVGAWDPHNVTEDADLGMRLYKHGYHTRTIDSTTFEEANSDLENWVRQRSRWMKGYIQTWLVHMRNPVKLFHEVGLKGFISFQFVAGGTFFSALVNPILWAITTVWFLTEWSFIQETYPGVIFYMGSLNLYLGNFVFTYMNVAGAMRRKHYDNVRYALLSPIYWGLMSIGAWKGFFQLITKPHYWEKTIHGLSQNNAINNKGNSKMHEGGNDDQ